MIIPSCLAVIIVLVTITSSNGFAKPTPGTDRPAHQPTTRGELITKDGVRLAYSPGGVQKKRIYPLGQSAGHLSGRLLKGKGSTGLERYFETKLSSGRSITLTIDSKIQKAAWNILASEKKTGSIVVQDPSTGHILAMVSWPSFAPSLFIPEISEKDWAAIQQDKNKPLLDRSITSYSPGSSIKHLVALSGEFAGLNNPKYRCTATLRLAEQGRIKLRDWNPNRNEFLRIPGAIKTSCNTYFMQLAIEAGWESLKKTGAIFQLDGEGFAPLRGQKATWLTNPDHEKKRTEVLLAISSIGQADVSLTPLQINTVTSAIVHGSYLAPSFRTSDQSVPVPLVGQGGITEQSLSAIRKGMEAAVQEKRGTTKRAKVPDLTVAGVSGTAIGGIRNARNQPLRHAWFTGYAPAKQAKLAITIFLENADSGSRDAAPLASKLFAQLLKKAE